MFKIGFTACEEDKSARSAGETMPAPAASPRKSVVRVHFPARNMTLSYYNDAFDLKRGDIVYVEGKLEGQRGCVVDVVYSFKIKLSEYKRVISVADTSVKGEFHFALSHFVTFDRTALPYEKAITWFKAPEKADEVYASGSGDPSFSLDDLSTMGIGKDAAERGHEYFMENKVCYIELDGSHGRAIVEGSRPYELEFSYWDDEDDEDVEIGNLTCDCFCASPCKHMFAAMLQLRETLGVINENYAEQCEKSGYFAAVSKAALLSFAVDGRKTGSIVL